MSKRIAEVLAMLPQVLYPVMVEGEDGPEEGPTTLCAAAELLASRGDITNSEANAASWIIMNPIRKYGANFLITMAHELGEVPPDCKRRSSEYIAYRDKWLADLILQEQQNE